MYIKIEEFNRAIDEVEYLTLLGKNMQVIRGEFVYLFSKNREKKQLERFLKDSRLFTIKVGLKTAGFTVYTVKDDDSTLFIEQLHLKPDFRDQGAGTEILKFLESQAKTLKCTKMEVGVYLKNPALRLYKRFGFSEVGFYRKIFWWIYRMRKSI